MEDKKYIITVNLESGDIEFNLDKLVLDQDSFRKLIADNAKIFCTLLETYENKYGKDDKLDKMKYNLRMYLKY